MRPYDIYLYMDNILTLMYCVAGEKRLAAFVAEHNLPFMVMEHLPNLIKTTCPDSKIADQIRCSKTKTNAIIQHITKKN